MLDPRIQEYIDLVQSGEVNACKWQKKLIDYVLNVFDTEDLTVESERLDEYLGLLDYFPYEDLMPWQKFVFALHTCTYRDDGTPRWGDLFLMIGRGAGKDGYIAFNCAALTSPYNPVRRYDVDICANNEEQARQPFDDFRDCLENPVQIKKLRNFWSWNKEEIVSIRRKSRIKYRTNNPKGKDGLRSGIVIFNEIHQYENYDNINVFTTGLGKKPEPRTIYATTNGDVRDGPLDDMLERSKAILDGLEPDGGLLPFICILDDKKLVHDPANWEQANPSLPYFPHLQAEIEKEYLIWKRDPSSLTAFMTKRMNIPDTDPEIAVATPENIMKTNRDIPYDQIAGKPATVGIDFSKSNDMTSAGILIRDGDMRYWIQHSWFCKSSPDAARIKAPFAEWERAGDMTLVDDVEINADDVVRWIADTARNYELRLVGIDSFRYAYMRQALESIGVDPKENKNLRLMRPSDQMRIWSVINSWFLNGQIVWGDVPLMRWATNNTKLVQSKQNKEKANYTYGKQEPRSRKTDPFMAFVHAASCELYDTYEEVDDWGNDLPVVSW